MRVKSSSDFFGKAMSFLDEKERGVKTGPTASRVNILRCDDPMIFRTNDDFPTPLSPRMTTLTYLNK